MTVIPGQTPSLCLIVSLCLCHQDAIVIHEVYEEGAAARDGRLWAGDQILEVTTGQTGLRARPCLEQMLDLNKHTV